MTLSFNVSPNGSVTANGNPVIDEEQVDYERGTVVHLHAEPDDGASFLGWNNGEWFDEDWDYIADEDAVITAEFSV